MDTDEILRRQAERAADPAFETEPIARAKVVEQRLRSLYVNELALALQNEKRPGKKFIWLKKLGDAMAKAHEGVAPCHEGCSHCCHMAVQVSLTEAKAIAKATGRALTIPPAAELRLSDANTLARRERYIGVPCSLLKDGRCSVYEHRPWACRVHYSLDRDNLMCQIIPGSPALTPAMDTKNLNVLYMLAHDDPLDVEMADIREFFKEEAP